MQLRKISVKGFKSISDSSMEFAPLTLLCGENSSGKSSLVDTILLLSQTSNGEPQKIEPSISTNGEVINLGSMEDIVSKNNFNKKNPISITYVLGPNSVQEIERGDEAYGYQITFNLFSDKKIGADNLSSLVIRLLRGTGEQTVVEKILRIDNTKEWDEINLDLTPEQLDSIEVKNDLLEYVVGSGVLKRMRDNLGPEINPFEFPEFGRLLRETGQAAPWVYASYTEQEYEYDIPDTNKLKEAIASTLDNNLKGFNGIEPLDSQFIEFDGGVFKSGIPQGFLRTQLLVFDQLEGIRNDLVDEEKINFHEIVEVINENNIDIHDLNEAIISEEGGVDCIKIDSTDPQDRAILSKFHQRYGYSLAHSQLLGQIPDGDVSLYKHIIPSNSYKEWSKKEEKDLLDAWYKGADSLDESSKYVSYTEIESLERSDHPLNENTYGLFYIKGQQQFCRPLSISEVSEWFQRNEIEVGMKLIDLGIPYGQVLTEYFYTLDTEFYTNLVKTGDSINKWMIDNPLIYEKDYIQRKRSTGKAFWDVIVYSYSKLLFGKTFLDGLTLSPEQFSELCIKFINQNFNYDEFVLIKDYEYILQDVVGGLLESSLDTFFEEDFELVNFNQIFKDLDVNLLRDEFFYLSFTPEDVSKITGKDKKTVRAKLRKDYPRDAKDKGSSWSLSPEQFFGLVEHWGIKEKDTVEDIQLSNSMTFGESKMAHEQNEEYTNKKNVRAPLVGLVVDTSPEAKKAANLYKSVNQDFASNVKYLGPLRQRMAKQDYQSNTTLGSGVVPLGKSAENFINFFHQNKENTITKIIPEFYIENNLLHVLLPDDKFTTLPFKAAFNEWLRYFELAWEFDTELDERTGAIIGKIKPWDTGEEFTTSIENVGVGFSQLAPVIALCLESNFQDTLIFEQPELHIHPEIQRSLADFFECMSVSTNILIETHSDHLINRLRLRVADPEGRLTSKDVSIVFAEKIDGSTQYRNAALRDDGSYDMTDYPQGFFNQATKDTLKMMEFRSKKNK